MKTSMDFGKKLSKEELSNLRGGSMKCVYTTDYKKPGGTCLEHGSAAGAEFMAGENGWWCCNCAEAEKCN
ncbi:rSAM-modified peptide [Massilibacteroides sp.]|uniref:rSAM-modified peptide n=1 Tax=Massilibacteroides sp. TaxID=2034766 RepID=UPI002632A225|nr:rSAM-modified peptide [Massilibacteroides sp.]MDD4516814.1 rSAM-modified peptide [Massilibacteroides sp.]